MKKYNKDKFHFIFDDGSIKEPEEGDIYVNCEYRFNFIFLKRKYIVYKLINNIWIEQDE